MDEGRSLNRIQTAGSDGPGSAAKIVACRSQRGTVAVSLASQGGRAMDEVPDARRATEPDEHRAVDVDLQQVQEALDLLERYCRRSRGGSGAPVSPHPADLVLALRNRINRMRAEPPRSGVGQ